MGVYFGGRECLDPLVEREACQSLGYPIAPWWEKVNSFTCPLGPAAGTGWVLLPYDCLRDTADSLRLNTLYDLVFADGQNTVTLKNLLIVRAFAVTPGYRGDPSAAFWCELRDKRHLYSGRPIDRAYNVRSAPGGTSYFSATTSGGVAWTWSGMIGDIWSVIGTSRLGTFPGLPFTPDGTPEGFDFYGGNAWDALAVVLERISCALRYDPITDAFSIIRIAATDAVATAALTRRDEERTWDSYPVESVRGRVPEYVRVQFLKSQANPDTTGGSPFYTLDRTDPTTGGALTGAESGTYALLFDDLPAVYNSSDVLTNAAALSSRADERAADYFRRIRSSRMDRIFTGALPDAGLRPGAQIKETTWRHLAHNQRHNDGLVTEARRYPGLGGTAPEQTTGAMLSEENVFLGDTEINAPWIVHNHLNLYQWRTYLTQWITQLIGQYLNCDPISWSEETIRCEQGYLQRYARTLRLEWTAGCPALNYGAWARVGTEGCCDCPASGSGSGDPCVPGTCSECDEAPYEWTVPVFGFTGTCGDMFNRTWHLIQDDPAVDCEWYEDVQVLGGTARCVLTISGGIATVSFQFGAFEPLTEIASYEAAITGDCCEIITLQQVSCNCSDSASADDCNWCEVTPATWTANISGCTGDFTDFNGEYEFSQDATDPCLWNSTTTTAKNASLYIYLGDHPHPGALLGTTSNSDGHWATWDLWTNLITDGDCCQPINVYPLSQNGSGTLSRFVTIVPSCSSEDAPSGCPDEIKAYAECCTDEWEGSGSGSGSGGGGTLTDCCPDDGMPDQITITLPSKTGGCTCLPDSATLTRNGPATWSNHHIATTGCSAPYAYIDFSLYCSGSDWILSSTLCGFSTAADSYTCDPLSLVWLGLSCGGGACTGGFDAVITE